MSALLTAGPERQARQNDEELAALAARCHYYMALMREAEDRIERKLYRQGKIVGGVYVGRGQEAIPVGTALHALPDDVLPPVASRYGRVVHPRHAAAAASSPSTWGGWTGSPAAATATCTWAT